MNLSRLEKKKKRRGGGREKTKERKKKIVSRRDNSWLPVVPLYKLFVGLLGDESEFNAKGRRKVEDARGNEGNGQAVDTVRILSQRRLVKKFFDGPRKPSCPLSAYNDAIIKPTV